MLDSRFASLALRLTPLLFVGGCINYGDVRLAKPKVFSDAQSRASMSRQGTLGVSGARAVAASSLNQFFSVRESIQQQLRVKFNPTAGDVDEPEEQAVPGSGLTSKLPEGAVGLPSPSEYNGLFAEELRDIANKEAAIEGHRLLYEGDLNVKGSKSRVFILRFDVWVEPRRQNYWTYLYRTFDWNNFYRNYTKDYDMELTFQIPPVFADANDDPDDPLVQVYAVSPVTEFISALEAGATQYSNGLALGLASPTEGLAGQYDYQRDRLEQFTELRKYPLTQGIVDSPTQFRFIFSPRRRLEERSFFAWLNPFASKYSIERRLEPGVRTVYALVLVRDVVKLKELWAVDANGEQVGRGGEQAGRGAVSNIAFEPVYTFGWLGVGYEGVSLVDSDAARDDAMACERLQACYEQVGDLEGAEALAATQAARKLLTPIMLDDSRLRLPLAFFAAYKELGNPRKQHFIPFPDERYPRRVLPREASFDDESPDVRSVTVDLSFPTSNVVSARYIKKKHTVALSLDYQDLRGATVQLFDAKTGIAVPGKAMELALSHKHKTVGPWQFRLPPALAAGVYYVAVGGEEFGSEPFEIKDSKKPGLDPASAFAGQVVTLRIDLSNQGAGVTVAGAAPVYFGNELVAPAGVLEPFTQAGRVFTGSFLAPIPADSSRVDVRVLLNNGKRHKVGTFTYLATDDRRHSHH